MRLSSHPHRLAYPRRGLYGTTLSGGDRRMERLEEILAANKEFVAHGKHDYTEEDIAANAAKGIDLK